MVLLGVLQAYCSQQTLLLDGHEDGNGFVVVRNLNLSLVVVNI